MKWRKRGGKRSLEDDKVMLEPPGQCWATEMAAIGDVEWPLEQ